MPKMLGAALIAFHVVIGRSRNNLALWSIIGRQKQSCTRLSLFGGWCRRRTTSDSLLISPVRCNNFFDEERLTELCQQGNVWDVVQFPQQQERERDGIIIEPLLEGSGFCNSLSKISFVRDDDVRRPTTRLVAKLFSRLALKRLNPFHNVGEIDALIGKHKLGPSILVAAPTTAIDSQPTNGILMEWIQGTCMTESMVHSEEGLSHCECAATRLALLHTLQPQIHSSEELEHNMLWHAVDVMLTTLKELVGDCKAMILRSDSPTAKSWTWSLLHSEVTRLRQELDQLNLPMVPIGHGDFKPSNVIIDSTTQIHYFLDLELAGRHYRGFDVAKFFRTDHPTASTLRNKEGFWKAYCHQFLLQTNLHSGLRMQNDRTELTRLVPLEAAVLEPLTWLEAAIFFLCSARIDDTAQSQKWNQLAAARLNSYDKCITGFDENVATYKRVRLGN